MSDSDNARGVPGSLTPEERATRSLDGVGLLTAQQDEGRRILEGRIAAAIRAAVAEEEAACLKILIEADGRGEAIAAIRARSQQ